LPVPCPTLVGGGPRHREAVLAGYVDHDNTHRPHRSSASNPRAAAQPAIARRQHACSATRPARRAHPRIRAGRIG
jgi:hypothetical protein